MDGKKLLLQLLRQVPRVAWVDADGKSDRSMRPWGRVLYKIPKEGDSWMLVEKDAQLGRCRIGIYEPNPIMVDATLQAVGHGVLPVPAQAGRTGGQRAVLVAPVGVGLLLRPAGLLLDPASSSSVGACKPGPAGSTLGPSRWHGKVLAASTVLGKAALPSHSGWLQAFWPAWASCTPMAQSRACTESTTAFSGAVRLLRRAGAGGATRAICVTSAGPCNQ